MSVGVDDDLGFEFEEDLVRIKKWLDQMEKETEIGGDTEDDDDEPIVEIVEISDLQKKMKILIQV